MTMAKPGVAQDQTVEEILASIRQVINGDQTRAAAAAQRPSAGAMTPPRSQPAAAPPPGGGNVTAIHGAKIATGEDEASGDEVSEDRTSEDKVSAPAAASAEAEKAAAPPAGRAQMNEVVELAIEKALGGVDPGDTRAETAAPETAEEPPPLQATAEPETLQPDREAPHVVAPQPVPERPRVIEAQPAREAPRAVEPPSRPERAPASGSLLSARANAAVAASFGDLAKVLAERDAREIDRVVEDLLRPMLKSWLEDNLPSLVERLVREEIERVSRGGR